MNNIKFNSKNVVILLFTFFLLLFFKRWNQLLDPEIWIEDGIYGIPTFIHYGWKDLFMDEGGFLKTINVLITNTGMTISPLYYPEISTYLSWIFTIFVSLAVVFSPTKLRFKLLAAVLIYFIPTGLENFGIPYYSYFWSGILLFLVVLWEPGKNLPLRVFYVLLGGLSSPNIFMLPFLQLFRVIFIREDRKQEVIVFLVILVVFAVQYNIFASDGFLGSHLVTDLDFILEYIRKFYGLYFLNYITGNDYLLQTLGGVYVLLLFFFYWIKNFKDPYFYLLMGLLIGTGLSAVLRKYINIDPISPGSRYYFYPYIMLTWSLLYVVGGKQLWLRFLAIPVLLLSVAISFYYPYRVHDKLSYKKYLIACSNPKNGLNIIPEHISGEKYKIYPWWFSLESSECKKLLEEDNFPIPDNLQVLKKDIRSLPKIAVPSDINYSLALHTLDESKSKKLQFSDKVPYFSGQMTLFKELDSMKYRLKGKIKSQNKIATLFVKIGDQIIFIDEDINSGGKRVAIDDKIVFSDYKDNTPKELYNKQSHFKLCAINKEGTGYYELFDIPITVTDLKTAFSKLPKVVNKKFAFGLDKLDQVDKQLRVVGWLTELNDNLPVSMMKTPIVVQIDKKIYLPDNKYRKDVANVLKNPKYTYSGFSVYMPIQELEEGKHVVKIYGLSYDRKNFFTPKKFWEFNIRKGKIVFTPKL
jgi:hypothetical protein